MTSTESRRLSVAEKNLEESAKKPFYKIVMTGGPCGGKTTGLARLYSFLNERGFEVMSCPETYTIFATNGMSGDFHSTEGMTSIIQSSVIHVQLNMEDAIEKILRGRGKPAVMICDRGVIDGAAYVSKEEWNKLLEQSNNTHHDLRDNRYHTVFHMVSAALGAEAHYTLENNAARSETMEEARALDKATQDAWLGHPHLYVFDNSTGFEGKMTRMIDVMCKLVGLPSNLKRRSAKFLLKSKPNVKNFPADIEFHVFQAEKVYLSTNYTIDFQKDKKDKNNQNYSFIRRRTVCLDPDGKSLGGSVYQLTNVEFNDGEMVEQKRIITEREYNAAFLTRDLGRHIVQQKRISFIWKMQSFSIHIYEKPLDDLYLLHAQVEAKNGNNGDVQVELPTFLDVERRISNNKEDDDKYGAYSISII